MINKQWFFLMEDIKCIKIHALYTVIAPENKNTFPWKEYSKVYEFIYAFSVMYEVYKLHHRFYFYSFWTANFILWSLVKHTFALAKRVFFWTVMRVGMRVTCRNQRAKSVDHGRRRKFKLVLWLERVPLKYKKCHYVPHVIWTRNPKSCSTKCWTLIT